MLAKPVFDFDLSRFGGAAAFLDTLSAVADADFIDEQADGVGRVKDHSSL
jgi:hypothetical protein